MIVSVKVEETNLKMYMETTIELYVSWKSLEYLNKELFGIVWQGYWIDILQFNSKLCNQICCIPRDIDSLRYNNERMRKYIQ